MIEINIFRHASDAQAVPAGHVLFREGDPGDTMFAVAEGEVELTVAGDVVEDVGPGGILGELALVDHAPRSATAIAKTATRWCRSTPIASATWSTSTRRSRCR